MAKGKKSNYVTVPGSKKLFSPKADRMQNTGVLPIRDKSIRVREKINRLDIGGEMNIIVDVKSFAEIPLENKKQVLTYNFFFA